MKSLGTYMCWTQLQLGNTYVQVFNCYLHPGEQQNLKDRAKRVLDIVGLGPRESPYLKLLATELTDKRTQACELATHRQA